ncbi:hypothetical protein Fcan01_16284 [Folsomia candida]|uniref:Uncharacterized protein n=1 Tax=Folsomia candida TaxID=158441 RepID=A0A226DU93_FOLCA|nr:hypothetical protein Fcan01_16284 [Folsomia candida]
MVIYSLNNLARMSPNIHALRIYQRFYILNKTMETMSSLLASLLLSFGFVFTVTCNFVSVRMYRVIPMPFYLVFPVGSIGATVGIMILLPYGIACHEISSKLLTGWRMAVSMKRGGTRDQEIIGNSLRPTTKLLVAWSKMLKIRRDRIKYEEKMANSLRHVAIRVGSGEFSFFMLTKSMKSKYYVSVTDYTINALMS